MAQVDRSAVLSSVFFCAAEGAVHTSNRRRYLKRLWQASAVMVLTEAVLDPLMSMYFKLRIGRFDNNIFLSLFQGVLIISMLESTKTTVGKGKNIFWDTGDISLQWLCCPMLPMWLTPLQRQG